MIRAVWNYELGLSYTWCNFIRVTHFFGLLIIIIRSKGEKPLMVMLLLFSKN